MFFDLCLHLGTHLRSVLVLCRYFLDCSLVLDEVLFFKGADVHFEKPVLETVFAEVSLDGAGCEVPRSVDCLAPSCYVEKRCYFFKKIEFLKNNCICYTVLLYPPYAHLFSCFEVTGNFSRIFQQPPCGDSHCLALPYLLHSLITVGNPSGPNEEVCPARICSSRFGSSWKPWVGTRDWECP